MAQPQGLNVPVIITTGVVGTLLIAAVVEGVYAYYNVETAAEEARKWDEIKVRSIDTLRDAQLKTIKFDSSIPIDEAMHGIVKSGGKLPSTRPTTG